MAKQDSIYQTEEFQTRKVVEHNDLISSVAKMDKIPLKIFELAVSCVDTDNPPKDNVVYMSKKELFSFFDVNDSNKHARFKKAIEKMQEQAFFKIKEKSGKGYKFKRILPIPTVEWNDYNDKVFIRFNPDIMPYLIELKTNFTQYAITDIIELNSKYSIILYKWFCMSYNQFEHYQHKPNRTQKQLEEYKNPRITVEELRRLTDTVDDYKRFFHFDERVLKQPLEEINKNTHFNVQYTKIKKGRSIESIEFHIEKKNLTQDMNGNYKKEQNDPQYLKSKEEKEQLKQKYFAQAMANPYTRMLNEAMLLFPHDLMDIETMANLQQFVYPIYDELKVEYGNEGVKKHISYVAAKQDDYSKRNISQYLKKSASTYLESLTFKKNMSRN